MTARIFKSLRKHRNYRLFFMGQIVSLAGSWMQNIALAWFVVELTDSALAIGLLAFCRFVPFMVLGLYAGVIVDRFDNRRLVIATQAAQMAVSLALTVWRSRAGRACPSSTCSRCSAARRSCSTRPAASR